MALHCQILVLVFDCDPPAFQRASSPSRFAADFTTQPRKLVLQLIRLLTEAHFEICRFSPRDGVGLARLLSHPVQDPPRVECAVAGRSPTPRVDASLN